MQRTSSRIYLLVELVAVLAIAHYGPSGLTALGKLGGVVLPDQPLLRHTYLAFALILLLMGWLRWRGARLGDFGLVVPRPVLRLIGFGLALALTQLVLDNVVRSVSTPLLVKWTGADPHLDTKAFAALAGNLPLYLLTVGSAWFYAALGEEFLYRGYVLTRVAQVLGKGRAAWGAAIAVQAVLFALAHWYQGLVGMVPIAVGAVLSGMATTIWGRNLWPAIVAHGLVDTLGFTMLYMGQPLS